MLTLIPGIKAVHVGAVTLSGTLFALRAAALIAGMRWPRAAPVRYTSYGIDTVLLLAALTLAGVLPAALFDNGWLWAKLAWVLAYIGLGIAAFRTQGSRAWRALLVASALGCFLQAYAIARNHHPAGLGLCAQTAKMPS